MRVESAESHMSAMRRAESGKLQFTEWFTMRSYVSAIDSVKNGAWP